MKIHADQEICVASGQCALLAPEVFTQRDEDGIVDLRTPEPASEQQEIARKAVLTCPSGALTLTEAPA